MTIKSYVVRYVDGDKTFEVTPPTVAWGVAAAVRSVRELPAFDARIVAVAEDGAETPLPTYEEALAEIDRLRALVVAFAVGARLKSDAGGWCNLTAPFDAYEALRAERDRPCS